jgi:PIN domain nuclease of toxin-antitoxin system
LYERGRLQLREDRSLSHDLKQLLAALRLEVLPITAEIALLSRSRLFKDGDPADRLIGATALHLGAPLITADTTLRPLAELNTTW